MYKFYHKTNEGSIINESYHKELKHAEIKLAKTLDSLDKHKVLVPNESLIFFKDTNLKPIITPPKQNIVKEFTVEVYSTLDSDVIHEINYLGIESIVLDEEKPNYEEGSNGNVVVQVKLMSDDAQIPVYSTLGSAGCDIYASTDFVLPAMSTTAKVSEDALDKVLSDIKVLGKVHKQHEYDKLNGRPILVIGEDYTNLKTYEEMQMELIAKSLKDLIETATYSTNVGRAHVKSGISVGIPIGSNIEMELRGRSGLAFKQGTDSFIGTLDEDYKNELNILMYNYTDKPIEFKKGERVCQAIFKKVIQVEFQEVEEINQEVVDNQYRLKNSSIRKVERVDGLGHTGN